MMDKKLILPFSIAFLSLAFLAVSFLVFASRGNPYLIRKKLRIGALLLTLTGVSAGCITSTCYAPLPPPPTNVMTLDQNTDSGYVSINLAKSNVLTGRITERRDSIFSFIIFDQKDTLWQAGDIFPSDSVFDEATEEFSITLDSAIIPGTYNLRFYNYQKDSIPGYDYFFLEISLKIVDY